MPGLRRGLDLGRHLLLRDDPFALHVAAPLGPDLVLHVQRGAACPLEVPHRPDDVDWVTVTCVSVGNKGQLHRLRNQARVGQHLAHRHEAQVGIPIHERGGAVPAHVDAVKPRLLD